MLMKTQFIVGGITDIISIIVFGVQQVDIIHKKSTEVFSAYGCSLPSGAGISLALNLLDLNQRPSD